MSRADRDPLDRFYTPDDLAFAVCIELEHHYSTLDPEDIVEPSVGGGAFARAAKLVWPHSTVTGIDVDDAAVGFADCDSMLVGDWEVAASCINRPVTVIGNPPFSTTTQQSRERAFAHVQAARTVGSLVGLVLPASWMLGGSNYCWLRIAAYAPRRVHPIIGRPWKGSREVALYVWTEHLEDYTSIGREIVWKGAI